MRSTIKIFATCACLTLLAPAQEEGEPDFSKVPAAPTAEAIAAGEAGIRTAWKNSLTAAHQIAASQGYRRRDTRWVQALPDKGFTIVPLQLYAGNDYYITLGIDEGGENVAATAFDPERMLIRSAPDYADGKLVLRITPKKSGPHYVRLHQKAAPKKPIHCALTYIYK